MRHKSYYIRILVLRAETRIINKNRFDSSHAYFHESPYILLWEISKFMPRHEFMGNYTSDP